jgi:hypothetical protein
LRCGDDLVFNENMLRTFLDSNKDDFMGRSPSGRGLPAKNITPELLKTIRDDMFMVDYYLTHQEDFTNPQHNLRNVDISKYIKRPEIAIGPSGILYYISNKCCKILIDHLENIKYNIFHFDEFSQSYPYIIEDCGVAYILYFNRIGFVHDEKMYTVDPTKNAIGYHTNMYK